MREGHFTITGLLDAIFIRARQVPLYSRYRIIMKDNRPGLQPGESVIIQSTSWGREQLEIYLAALDESAGNGDNEEKPIR